MHFIFYYSGAAYQGKADYMQQDEGFVDMVGGLLHQALSTMEYDSPLVSKAKPEKVAEIKKKGKIVTAC